MSEHIKMAEGLESQAENLRDEARRRLYEKLGLDTEDAKDIVAAFKPPR